MLDESKRLMLLGITVFEARNLEIRCDFDDSQALIEVVSSAGDDTQYQIKSSLTAADKNKIFSIICTAFNRDLNRLELTIPSIEWSIDLP